MTASFLAPRSAKTLNRKPAEVSSWKKFAGVCSAAARMWPAVSWTDQPWHQDWAAHCAGDSVVQVSAIWARSACMCFQISSDFIPMPPLSCCVPGDLAGRGGGLACT